MSPSWRRVLITVIVAAGVAGGLVYAFRPQPVAVDLAAVTRGPLQVTVDDEGRTRVREVYVVSAPLSGRVLRIDSHVGDPVTAGETVLATIEPGDPTFLDRRSQTEAEAAVKAAEAARALAAAELTRMRAELEFAGAELKRARALAVRGTISQSALDRAELEQKTRRAGVASAEAALKVRTFELETARARLIVPGGDGDRDGREAPACCVKVRAPENGRVLRVLHESEGVVAAGTPLLEIGDPRDLEIVVDLLSADAVKIVEGAPVLIDEWGGGATLAGRVRRVEPYGFTKVSALGIEEQRVNVVIDLADPPEKWRSLGHGYRVETRIVVWHGADVLRLPLSALFRDGDAWAVFVADDGTARLRHVSMGHRNSLQAEVVDGVGEGDRVILHPGDRVADGTRIVPRP